MNKFMEVSFELGTLITVVISLLTVVVVVTLFFAKLEKRISLLETRFSSIEDEMLLIKGKFLDVGLLNIHSRGLRTMSIPIPDPELEKLVSDKTVRLIEDQLFWVHFRYDLNKIDDDLKFAALAFEVEKLIRNKKIPKEEVDNVRRFLENKGVRVTNNELAIAFTAVAWQKLKDKIKKIAKMNRKVVFK